MSPYKNRKKLLPQTLIGGILIGSPVVSKERRWVEDTLRRSNSFLDSVIENIPHMIFVKDARELRFIRFNRAGEELIGFSKKDLIGKNDYDFFPKEEADLFTRKDREVLNSGRMFDIPHERIHTKKKGVRILHTKKIPIMDEKGRPAFLLGMSEDITDRIRMETEIAAVSDREQRRIGQDLHDGLGQLLTGIAFLSKGLAQKLAKLELTESEDAQRIAEFVNQAIATTRDMAKILNPVELETGGLGSALKLMVSKTKKIFKLNVRLTIKCSLRDFEGSSAVQFYRIVQEAVDNAIRHAHATEISISVSKRKEGVFLQVSDNGKGLPRNYQRRKGMGINNMTYRARMLGGDLVLRDAPGGGIVVSCVVSPVPTV